MNNKKILIVDDEPHIRALLEQTLESLEDNGTELLFAKDGEEGLAMALHHLPEIIFLDIMMPKMNGYDACRQIKQQTSSYVVLLTAKGQETDRQKGLEAGADEYIFKPFDPDAVLLKAIKLLNR
ncbi:response regulator transcription factor [Sporomusa sphaeroides]|uniref:Alkaline phosphatase synthesis transcriptional regulatory protein PhoP n=2 Tax=Sporomusa TaxID=2375 RepID=A0ABM9W700_9FIRM|nr:response regulator [Sporomusa sphaeroides]OLS54824.1 alkaline phosphatase synthesis transcriptional regulatory protein PhoP [Sporomusa sphaeroides DSM 2875]CVK20027.1 Alkaline phosphatase synthesis transcriptional regulatory protein PhoP [Sporomusa sphaeroides DSM 2875]SCM83002.1 Response regulator receiver protein [uncultured Sporomusa sp.]